jgi:hypothetical protein
MSDSSSLTYFSEILTTDLRALAAMRIGCGLAILLDLAVRATDLKFFYAADGIASGASFWGYNWSLHHLNGSILFQGFLFILAAIFSVMLVVGYQTRVASFLSWLFLVSLIHRNEMVINSGDYLFSSLLFFGVFLPWDQRYSLDQRQGRIRTGSENRIINFAAIGILFQLALLYAEAAYYKNGSQWRTDYTALYHVFMSQQYSTRLSEYLLSFPELLKFSTYFSFKLEAAFAALLFLPFWFSAIRTFLFLGLLFLHIGIFFFMDVGMFPMISTVTSIILIPPKVWDWFSATGSRSDSYLPKLWRTRLDFIPLIVIFLLVVSSPFRLLKKTDGFYQNFLEATYALGLHQPWIMFSPQGGEELWWYIVKAQFRDGSFKNMFPVVHEFNFEKPERVNETFRNQRWSKFMSNLWYHKNIRYRQILLKSYCNNDMTELELIYVSQAILPEQKYGPTQKYPVAKINCD